jgi:transcription elongation GreA/GreB family factor
MHDAQQSANEESKSSAGDKYETGRAMMQIERDKAAQQLDEALKLKNTLEQISLQARSDNIMLGTLVITDSKKIFISIGLGKVTIDDQEFLVVAPASPLGKVLMGLKVNDQVVFNKERLTILQLL